MLHKIAAVPLNRRSTEWSKFGDATEGEETECLRIQSVKSRFGCFDQGGAERSKGAAEKASALKNSSKLAFARGLAPVRG